MPRPTTDRPRTPDAGRGRVACWALALTLSIAASLALTGTLFAKSTPVLSRAEVSCGKPPLHLRCPDLIMSAPSEMRFDRRTIPGRVLLRATSSLNNLGRGPLEVSAHRHGGKWRVYQAIYDRHGHRHVFHAAAKLIFKRVLGERFEYGNVGTEYYWKFAHAAAFQLWSIDANRRLLHLVRTGPKVDYCLRDLIRSHPSPRSPASAHFPGCNQSPYIKHDVLGTSVGWSDVYPAEYPEQWIDVTGLHGRFAYVQIADPRNLLIEADEHNNASETFISLPSGRVLGHRVGVPAP